MNFQFDKKTNNFIKIILKNALSQQIRVFFVGGIVRDKLLNMPTLDIDLLILGNAIEFSKTLPKEIKIKSFHEDFCTVKLQYEDIEIDIASSRVESYPFSGCLPVVEEIGVKLEKDVLRRDFAINSLYCELGLFEDKISYKLIDLVHGLDDIKEKKLRVLHNNSYIDDPTRIIRGLGFKYRFGFDFSCYDKELIEKYFQNVAYSNMSIDRNKKIIKQVLNSSFQQEIFKELVEKKYYKIINDKEISVNFELISKIFDDFCLDMMIMSELYLKILLDEQVLPIKTDDFLNIYKTFSKMSELDLAYYFYKTQDLNVLKFLEIKDIKLIANGDDLIKLGYIQGQQIGLILNSLLKDKLENPEKFESKADEIEWILKKFPQK